MFPGTSVLLTRARYYLFVPWAFQLAAERKKTNPAAILSTAENYARSLIEAIRKSGDLEGLIGRQSVTKVRTLPSQIYQGGLASYGILEPGAAQSGPRRSARVRRSRIPVAIALRSIVLTGPVHGLTARRSRNGLDVTWQT